MDGSRFDELARSWARIPAGRGSRRGFLGGLAEVAAGLLGTGAVGAQEPCLPDQVWRRRVGCVCRTTGRPPVNGTCPCRLGLTNCGGVCVDLERSDAHCGACDVVYDPSTVPNAAAMRCVGGACQITACAQGFGDCDGDPATGCETPLGNLTNCSFCGEVCADPTPFCDPALGCVECEVDDDCPTDGDLCSTPSVCDAGFCRPPEGVQCATGQVCSGGACIGTGGCTDFIGDLCSESCGTSIGTCDVTTEGAFFCSGGVRCASAQTCDSSYDCPDGFACEADSVGSSCPFVCRPICTAAALTAAAASPSVPRDSSANRPRRADGPEASSGPSSSLVAPTAERRRGTPGRRPCDHCRMADDEPATIGSRLTVQRFQQKWCEIALTERAAMGARGQEP